VVQSRGGKTAEQLRLWLDGRVCYISLQYMAVIDNDDHARKKGTAELLVLAQLESRPRHGYDIGTEIERRTGGEVSFQIATPGARFLAALRRAGGLENA
jgi:hypothetical protein